MFKAANPYDETVTKATDENLTSENWQLNLDVCDKVSNEGDSGARNCVAAILKRLVHRNANVQLYALTLSDALSKNCGIIVHRELASRSYCQTLQRIIVDRNTHFTVKKKAISLIKEWNQEWGKDESLGILRETMDTLKRQGISFEDSEHQSEAAPTEPSSEQLRAEDEELRRVLELSIQDQGGRGSTSNPSQQAYNGSAEASSSTSQGGQLNNNGTATSTVGDVNKNLPDPTRIQASDWSASQAKQPQAPSASRVRALYDFTPSEEGELAFQKGDVIRILDSVYEHWWRGELNGEAGIFPVNYVELLPDPTPADIQREAELEAHIFAQAIHIDRLLSKLRGLDPSRDNLADDDEIQELYQSSLAMRPKIVKLIDRYNLKVNELRMMNEKFVRARTTFDAMMEQNLGNYPVAGTPNQQNPPSQYFAQNNANPVVNANAYQYPGGLQPTTPRPNVQQQGTAQHYPAGPQQNNPQAPQYYQSNSSYQQPPPASSPSITQQTSHQQQYSQNSSFNATNSQGYGGAAWTSTSWYPSDQAQQAPPASQQGYPVQ